MGGGVREHKLRVSAAARCSCGFKQARDGWGRYSEAQEQLDEAKVKCMRVYACACVCMRVYACVCVSMRVYACVCVSMRVYACVCVCMRVYACVCVCMRVYACVCACMRVYACVCLGCLTLAQEREIRIVGELKQSREGHKRDSSKLSSERDALEDAGACACVCVCMCVCVCRGRGRHKE